MAQIVLHHSLKVENPLEQMIFKLVQQVVGQHEKISTDDTLIIQ
jgi:hypothetical protein